MVEQIDLKLGLGNIAFLLVYNFNLKALIKNRYRIA